jgi:hypothetical protein
MSDGDAATPMATEATTPAAASTPVAPAAPAAPPVDPAVERRNQVLADYRKTLLQHKETDGKVRQSAWPRPQNTPPALSFFSHALLT